MTYNSQKIIKRMDIYYADLNSIKSSKDGEQGGMRPVLVVSNDVANKYSPVVSILTMTSQIKKYLPIHYILEPNRNNGLSKKTVVQAEQSYTISKDRLRIKIGSLCGDDCEKVNDIIKIQFGLQ